MNYLFEVSWEVCNKVSGVHNVIRTKVPYACQEFGERYFLLGPLKSENPEFHEANEPESEPIIRALQEKGIRCKFGRWKIKGEPKVILIDSRDRYDVNKVLYSCWQDFGVDSYAGRWDYIEPVLFSTACAEAIETIYDVVVTEEDRAVAHFHEWIAGAGLLYLKKKMPEIGTVFTAYATVLGRAMASSGRDFFHELEHLNPLEEAQTYGVSAKHSMETVCAREADCFTTVSSVTAEEASAILQKAPDKIVSSGVNITDIPDFSVSKKEKAESRKFLLNFARNFLKKDLSPETRLWATSGHYEFHNRGFDVFLESLSQLDKRLTDQDVPVVAFFLIAVGHKGVQELVRRRIRAKEPWGEEPAGITTHHLYDEHNDPIVRKSYHLELRNSTDNKVNIIFSPAYLDGHDGIFDVPYEQILSGCDLGIYPSFYEPWGLTPIESLALSVPVVTSDLAGFGKWANDIAPDEEKGVFLLPRKQRTNEEVVQDLTDLLQRYSALDEGQLAALASKTREIAEQADWNVFYGGYLEAYELAVGTASDRFNILDTSAFSDKVLTTFKGGHHCETPRYRSFTAFATLPKKLEGLREIAYNLWWSWNPDARALFAEIDIDLWLDTQQNPVKLLSHVPNEVLQEKAEDKAFLSRYRKVLGAFHEYMGDKSFLLEPSKSVSAENPVAYFSMEYGLHECLPVYSGGLGILAGDHLKSASDLNIPLIGVGLFYRRGYFTQRIDRDGNQVAEYPLMDCSTLPLNPLLDDKGEEVMVALGLRGRTLYSRVWIAQVGRVKLHLLDSDVEENEPEDRELTSQLYGGDRRMRVKQELLLGIGGIRLIRDILQIQPSVYHLTEGHVGFLLLERMKNFIQQGLSPQEAREAVKASSVFTTHTPVPAGNETFEHQLLEHYLFSYVQEMGMTWEQFLELGAETPHSTKHAFSMTVLCLKLSSKANAVSKLHGKVCREMWQNVWKGVNLEEIPIFSITNGIHLQTWVSREMRAIYDEYLAIQWGRNEEDPAVWAAVNDIPDKVLWDQRLSQKKRLIERLKIRIAEDYARRGEDPQLIRDTIRSLNPNKLTIGFARRFAPYKRPALLFRDMERLKRLVSDPERPVQFLFAGKAHPADGIGQGLIKRIVEMSRSEEFRGKVIYVEGYDMGIGRLLTRGVDVWLNNPVRPYEASGTSGMKVGPNLGLNFSIRDGWWDEGFEEDLGWEINAGTESKNREYQDEIDNMALLDTLEQQIVPLYYDINEEHYSSGWVRLIKNAVRKLSVNFNTTRMLKQYYSQSYFPTAERMGILYEDDFASIKSLTAWKRQISSRFATVQIEKVVVKGIRGELMPAGGEIDIEMFVSPGKLEPLEIQAEFLLGLREGNVFAEETEILQFKLLGVVANSDVLHFQLKHRVRQSGNYLYALRVVPVHKLLSTPQETGLMCWG